MSMQKVALEYFQWQIFQELKEVEEQKTEEARMTQGMELSRAVGHFSGASDNFSFGSCSSSLAHDMNEANVRVLLGRTRCG